MNTGLRGWNDYELPPVDAAGNKVPVDVADEFFTTRLRPDHVFPEKKCKTTCRSGSHPRMWCMDVSNGVGALRERE